MGFNFRQKIFLCYLIAFVLFIILISPFSSLIVNRVVEKGMENRARELIAKIQTAPNNEVMVRRLKELKSLIFFRVSVISDDRRVLYDSHTKRLLGPRFSQEQAVNHPEVLEAFSKGIGYHEDYSDILAQKFAYTAIAFDFHGKPYVMRTAFPYRYVKELINDFEIWFLVLISTVLILFSLLTWFIIHHLTKPIQQIITTVSSYKENEKNPLPELRELSSKISGEEAGKLASTLLSLSERLQNQIASLREERNEKEVLLESLVEGVIASDRDMNITFANLAAVKFLGLQKQQIIGHALKTVAPEKAYALVVTCQKENHPVIDTLQIDGSQVYYLDIVAVPKRDNTGAILVMLDKSDHYKILEMRKDFIANASHELKTPITIIRGFAETLHDNPGLNKEMMQDVTEKIVRNCERMANLIRDLLALADIENIPSSRLELFDLIPLLNRVIHTVSAVYPEANIKIINSLSPEVQLQGDSDLIEMCFMNLIQNAVKYSHPPADVTLHISQEGDFLKIEVADKGIGIPEEDLDRIFERFYRVDKARSKKMGGSGLGLSIVDTIIRKHFGKISVKSQLNVGTTFTILLPHQAEKPA